MKTILAIIGLSIELVANAAVTNVTFTVKVEKDVANGTNSVTLKYLWPGTAKDQQAVRAMVWYFESYQSTNNGVGTNATLEAALKNDIRDRVVVPKIKESSVSDNAVRIQKLTELLGSQTDALSAGDLSSIDSIISKWTAP